MVRLLAVSDETQDLLWRPSVRELAPDVVLACGDLPWAYLEYLVDTLDVPVAFVPGNHDPALPEYDQAWTGLLTVAGMPGPDPRPRGCVNVDGRLLDVAGLRVVGLGGSVRYRPGPHQYTQREFARRARRLTAVVRRRWRHDHRPVDVLLTHAPPAGLGDGDDPAHQGIDALAGLVAAIRPRLLLHGHIHPYGRATPDRRLYGATVRNVIPHRLIELDTAVPQPAG